MPLRARVPVAVIPSMAYAVALNRVGPRNAARGEVSSDGVRFADFAGGAVTSGACGLQAGISNKATANKPTM
jgi:hypothetical protein